MIYLAIAISFLATISIYPFFIKYLKAKSAGVSTKWYERQEQNEKNGTPVMGGLVFLAVALVVAIVLGLGTNTLTEMYPLIVATIGFGFIGLVDDIEKIIPDDASRNSFVLRFSDFFKKRAEKKGYDWGKGLTPPAKLTLQITFSAISAALVLVYAPHSSFNLIFTLIYFAFSLVWILGFSNATNITDGLDGLLTSLSIFSFLAFVFVIAKSPDAQQHLGLMYFDLLLITSLLAFLFFNKPKAQIFMGDTGSLALGALLAVNSLVIQKPWLMFFFGMVYIIETASTILQVAYYRLTKKRLFPMAPIHHTFQKFGWSEIKIDLLFNLVNLIFIFLGLYILDLLNIVEFIK